MLTIPCPPASPRPHREEKSLPGSSYRTAANDKFPVKSTTEAREFDSCIIKIVRAGRIKPVLFLSSFSLYYLVIFSDM